MELQSKSIPARDESSRHLIGVLHGLGDTLEGFSWLPAALKLDALNYLLVNAPDPYFPGYSWFDLEGDSGPGIARSRDLLWNLLDEQREAGYPTEQTFLFGFSQGAVMTLEMGTRYPHLFGGLIAISGFVHQPATLVAERSEVAAQQHFLVTHGDQDTLLPIQTVRSQIRQLQEAGLNIDWREYQKGHTIAGDEEINVIRDFIRARLG